MVGDVKETGKVVVSLTFNGKKVLFSKFMKILEDSYDLAVKASAEELINSRLNGTLDQIEGYIIQLRDMVKRKIEEAGFGRLEE
jgi:hypothetical protein